MRLSFQVLQTSEAVHRLLEDIQKPSAPWRQASRQREAVEYAHLVLGLIVGFLGMDDHTIHALNNQEAKLLFSAVFFKIQYFL